MKSQFGGLFSAFLMLLPLLAVPALAIVGLPEPKRQADFSDDEFFELSDVESKSTAMNFDEFAAADDSNRNAFERSTGDAPAWNSDDGTNDSATPRSSSMESRSVADDNDEPLFSPFVTVEDADEVARIFASVKDGDSDSSTISQPAFNPVANPFGAESSQSNPPAKEMAAVTTQPQIEPVGLTWPAVVQRLNELGISKYRLQESRSGQGFSFACLYAHPSQPEIQHRFEADGAEPIQAVVDVLNQVNDWQHSAAVAVNSASQ